MHKRQRSETANSISEASSNRQGKLPRSSSRLRTYMVKNSQPLEERRCLELKFHERMKVIGEKRSFLEGIGDYMPEIKASIVTGDDCESPKVIGYIRAYLLQLSRIRIEQVDLWAMCDEESEQMSRVYLALFNEDGTPKETFASQLEKTGVGNIDSVLCIGEVRLEKEYRGCGLGLLAVDGLISSYFADIVVLSPSGLAQETGVNAMLLKLAGLPNDVPTVADRQATQQKLISYWELLGFDTWAQECDEHDTLMGLWTRERPDIEDIVPHIFTRPSGM